MAARLPTPRCRKRTLSCRTPREMSSFFCWTVWGKRSFPVICRQIRFFAAIRSCVSPPFSLPRPQLQPRPWKQRFFPLRAAGWVYWPPLGKNVALYPNTTDDGMPAASVHIGNTFLPVETITGLVRKRHTVSSFSVHETGDLRARELPGVLNHIRTLCQEPGPHLIYGYVNEPDHLLHKTGCSSQAVHDYLREADRQLERLAADCPDTLFFLTADHGFTDIRGLCLEDAPELAATLLRGPSIEPRAMNLFVKSERRPDFLSLWQEAVGDAYRLYSHEQVLEEELFGPGPVHPLLNDMLGDYLAVAQTELTMFPTRSYLRSMTAAHGGMTPQELTVPLIAVRS